MSLLNEQITQNEEFARNLLKNKMKLTKDILVTHI